MDDVEIMQRISELVDEEHHMQRSADGLSDDEAARLLRIEVALDHCWDLLRQRRACPHAGNDPDSASVRSESTVEGYQQ